MNLVERTRERARRNPKAIVLPESHDERVLRAAGEVQSEGLANVILLGEPHHVRREASRLGVILNNVEILDPKKSPKRDEYLELLYELRKEKGLSRDDAKTLLQDDLYWAALMVRSGDADGYVSGATHSTARTFRPAFQVLRPRKGVSSVSGFSIVILPTPDWGEKGVLFFADTGINPEPTSEQLAETAVLTAESFEALVEERPRVAMLSFSTRSSADHPLIRKVVEATRLAREKAPLLDIDGELQVDSALVPEVAARKIAGPSPVAGRANVLIFPDLNSGNIAYKLVERLARAQAIGPISQGLAYPANDLSRGCRTDDIVLAIAVTVLQAQKRESRVESLELGAQIVEGRQ